MVGGDYQNGFFLVDFFFILNCNNQKQMVDG